MQSARSSLPSSDFAPAFSPDGRRLAYASCAASIAGCHVYVIELDAALAPTAPARRVDHPSVLIISSLVWTRDGRAVVYSAQPGPFMAYLWQVAADGTRPPARIEVAGRGATMPATVLARTGWHSFGSCQIRMSTGFETGASAPARGVLDIPRYRIALLARWPPSRFFLDALW